MLRAFAIVCGVLCFAPGALANDKDRLVGTWKLKAHVQETVETGEKWLPRGENPNGYFIFAPDGRGNGAATRWENRPVPVMVEEPSIRRRGHLLPRLILVCQR